MQHEFYESRFPADKKVELWVMCHLRGRKHMSCVKFKPPVLLLYLTTKIVMLLLSDKIKKFKQNKQKFI